MTTQTAPAGQPSGRAGRAARAMHALLRRLLRSPDGFIAVVLLSIFSVLAIAGGRLAPYNPNANRTADSLLPPSGAHLFGTDELGRDILSRVMDGARIAVLVALVSVAIAMIVGVLIGVVSGYFGGLTDLVLVRLMDVIFAFPTLLLAIIVVAVLGPGLVNAIVAIGIVYIPRFARVARSASLSIRNTQYIEAAKLCGAPPWRILGRHVVPNVMPSVIVLAALSMSTAQLAYATLSFLGLGVSPPQADWGSMLSLARDFITIAPWLVIFPTTALVLLILAFNLFGDAVRDILDPHSKSASGGPSDTTLAV